MPKVYKRILTPLFFAVVALVILCCSAFADDVSGVPFISINNGTPVPWTSNISISEGDYIDIVSSGIVSFTVTTPSNSVFTINPNVNVVFINYIDVYGTLNIYGNLSRSSSTSTGSTTGVIQNHGVINQYFGSVVRDDYGDRVINMSPGSTYNMYNGSISTNLSSSAIIGRQNAQFNLYDGIIYAEIPWNNIEYINIIGNLTSDTVNGIYSVSPKLLSVISDIVSSSVSWITTFIETITSNMLLLAFMLVIFTGLGIGILRRVKSI